MSGENHCTVIFVRYPEKGRVKSRLAAAFGEGFVCALYTAFVKDLLATLAGCGRPFRIAFTPAEREADIRRLFGRHDCFPQRGADLGERMQNALQDCFAEGFASAVIIGSDVPDLPPELLAEAAAALADHDAVLGPALDGGYYLIGFRQETLVPEVFAGVAWGSGGVFAETMARLARAGSGVRVLERLRDMDRPEDLRDLIERNRETPFARSRTMACLAAGTPGTVR